MKTILGATLAALVLAAPMLATAATVWNAANQQPELMAANAGATSSTYSESHPYAVLDYQNGVHLMPSSPVARNAQVPYDHTLALVNRTGGDR
jgi:hypothetical protein